EREAAGARRCRGRYRVGRRDRDGTRLRRRAHEYRDRRCARSDPHGARDAPRSPGRARRIPRRAHPAQTPRLGIEPDRRPRDLMRNADGPMCEAAVFQGRVPVSDPSTDDVNDPIDAGTRGRTPVDETSRHIRSFVLRQGRITPAQERAFAQHWGRYGLEPRGTPRDFAAVFGRRAPLVLEIGFGNGEQLCAAAAAEPERDFVGIEVHRPGVGHLLNALAAAALDNVRLYHHDAIEVLRDDIAPAALAETRIGFPDPWPKKRHHKRRLIQPGFVALLASRTAPGGRLHLATDWAGY